MRKALAALYSEHGTKTDRKIRYAISGVFVFRLQSTTGLNT
jgi:hypothetical protein